MTALQLGNSVAGSGSVDTGRRGFIRRLSVAWFTIILATTTGCASLVERRPHEEALKEIVLKKKIVFGNIREPMSPNISIECYDSLSGNCTLTHPNLRLLTSTRIKVNLQWTFEPQEVNVDGDLFFLQIASKKYWPVEYNSRLKIWEEAGIIYIEKLPSKPDMTIAQNEDDQK
jgi:hypothetical protein